MLIADFESMVKLVDETYRDKMNQMKAERKDNLPDKEKINMRVPPWWRIHSMFAYGNVINPLKMYLVENCV